MVETPKAENLVRTAGSIGPDDRARLLGQRGCVVWLTGLSGSGKSTIAQALEERLVRAGRATYVLDGDNVRHGLNADLGFSPDDRRENIRRVGEVAALLADAGLVTIVALISSYRASRQQARRAAGDGRFIEVFMDIPLAECEKRDPKGLYGKARRGEIRDFTGVDAPYEPPDEPELALKTSNLGVDECVVAIESCLQARGLLPQAGSEPAPAGSGG